MQFFYVFILSVVSFQLSNYLSQLSNEQLNVTLSKSTIENRETAFIAKNDLISTLSYYKIEPPVFLLQQAVLYYWTWSGIVYKPEDLHAVNSMEMYVKTIGSEAFNKYLKTTNDFGELLAKEYNRAAEKIIIFQSILAVVQILTIFYALWLGFLSSVLKGNKAVFNPETP